LTEAQYLCQWSESATTTAFRKSVNQGNHHEHSIWVDKARVDDRVLMGVAERLLL
jgi:hypothetical protein